MTTSGRKIPAFPPGLKVEKDQSPVDGDGGEWVQRGQFHAGVHGTRESLACAVRTQEGLACAPRPRSDTLIGVVSTQRIPKLHNEARVKSDTYADLKRQFPKNILMERHVGPVWLYRLSWRSRGSTRLVMRVCHTDMHNRRS